MSITYEILKRQNFPLRQFTGGLGWLFSDFQCSRCDELQFEGVTEDHVPPLACKFNRDGLQGNLLAVADEEGTVVLFDTRKRLAGSRLLDYKAHKNAIFDIVWVPGGTKLATASGDTTVRLWDVVGETLLTTFVSHSGSVKSVDVKWDQPSVFVSAGRDGSILMWDTRCSGKGSTHRPINSIRNAHVNERNSEVTKKGGRLITVGSSSASVTAALFHGDDKLASCGASDGTVKLWDLRKHYSSNKTVLPTPWHSFSTVEKGGRGFGFNSLISDQYQSSLFASSTDNVIYKYSSVTLNKAPVDAFSGHQSSMFYVKICLSHDGNYLLSGSNCGNAFIWQVKNSKAPPILLTGHEKEVTTVSWCPTAIDKIATCSDNNDLRLWRVVRNQCGRDAAQVPGQFIGSTVTYSGQGHLKAQESMKRYKESPNHKLQGTGETSTNKNQVQSGTSKDEYIFSKENACANITSITSTSKTTVYLKTPSPLGSSPDGTTRQLPGLCSIMRYLAPVSRKNVIGNSGQDLTDVKKDDVNMRENGHCNLCVDKETQQGPKRSVTAGGKKRKLNHIAKDESQSKPKKPRGSNREGSVNGTKTSACDDSPAARTRFTQPSLQSFFKPKQLVSNA